MPRRKSDFTFHDVTRVELFPIIERDDPLTAVRHIRIVQGNIYVEIVLFADNKTQLMMD